MVYRNRFRETTHEKVLLTQPAYNVGMTLIISCIYVATSNNINTFFSASGHRRHKDVDILCRHNVEIKSTTKPNIITTSGYQRYKDVEI